MDSGANVGCGGWQFPNRHYPRRNFPALLCAMPKTTYSLMHQCHSHSVAIHFILCFTSTKETRSITPFPCIQSGPKLPFSLTFLVLLNF